MKVALGSFSSPLKRARRHTSLALAVVVLRQTLWCSDCLVVPCAAQAKQAETEKRVSDLASQLEALQHENETLHRQNLTLQSALVVRSSESVLQMVPRPATDPTVSTSGQARSSARGRVSLCAVCGPACRPALQRCLLNDN